MRKRKEYPNKVKIMIKISRIQLLCGFNGKETIKKELLKVINKLFKPITKYFSVK